MPRLDSDGYTATYSGRSSLLELVDRHATILLDLIDEAGRRGWITGDWWQEFDQALGHLVVVHDIPQEPIEFRGDGSRGPI